MLKRETYIYCAVTAIVTLCEIVPDVAVMVRFEVVGVGVMLAADFCDEEHPAIPARATKRSAAKNDPRTSSARRFRPAKARSPIGAINERVMPAGEWNKWTA